MFNIHLVLLWGTITNLNTITNDMGEQQSERQLLKPIGRMWGSIPKLLVTD